MTDNVNPLDEARPWIKDEDELPSRMNWFAALLFPFGRSPQLHYTRVWVLLLLPRLFVYFGILGLGSKRSGVELIGPILAVLVIEVLSFIAITRRLNDAGRSPFFAWAVFVPALLGLGLAVVMVPGAKEAHKQAVIEFNEAKDAKPGENGQGVNGRQARRAAQGNRARGGRRGRRGGRGGRGGPAGPPQETPFVISKTLGMTGGLWFGGSLIVMIWSLAWAGRLPRGGRDDVGDNYSA